MQKCDTISLPYRLDNVSTSHIIRFGMCTTEKVCPRIYFAQRCTMEIHPSYLIISFTAEKSQIQ